MESSNNVFKYKPLRPTDTSHPIRLLQLLPAANFNDEIHCELIHTTLEDKLDFEALSYTWGASTGTNPIFLQGQAFKITDNLQSALRHLRRPTSPRMLWVDALCINQTDLSERSHQVAHMCSIYDTGGASRVVVWLGEAGTAQLALDFCKRLTKEEPIFAALPGFEKEWEACHELFVERKWWERSWILQEVVHTNEVIVCIGDLGPMAIEDLCQAFETYTFLVRTRTRLQEVAARSGVIIDENFPAAIINDEDLKKHDWGSWIRSQAHLTETPLQIKDLRAEAKGVKATEYSTWPLKLPSLMMRFGDHECSDFHDKIYAFMGLADRGPIWMAVPFDYGLSKRTFYTILARAVLKNSLLMLCLVEGRSRKVEGYGELPSWVMDWTMKQGYVAKAYVSTYINFHADNGFVGIEREPRHEDLEGCEVLVLRGVYVAVITGVVEARITQDENIKELDRLKLIRYDEDPQIRDRGFVQEPAPPWQTTDLETGIPLISHSNTSWGPVFCEVGDIIIVAAGSRIPLVLRKFQEGKYIFVGACWLVDGEIQNPRKLEADPGFSKIMFGSACEGLAAGDEVEMFSVY